MTYAVDVYKNGTKLGSGTATAASKTISSYTALIAGNSPAGKNVQVVATAGNNIGAKIDTRVITDNTTSLVMQDAGPFS
ncbi:MAG: hypothetical protein WC213_00040 [Arenimonas sp.]|jgi:hypothetical protein